MVELVNPYDTSRPVSEEKMFFGRDAVLAWVRENLIGGRRAFVLHGPRRIGKTSLLRHLAHHLPPGYAPTFLDLRSVKQLNSQFSILNSQVRESLGDRQLVLMADNLEALADTEGVKLAHAFLSYLADMLKDEPWIRLILALHHPGDFEREHPHLFAIAAYRKLGSLNSTESASLIREPVRDMLDYDVGVTRRIMELTSNHPYFIQLLCYTLFNRCARSGRATLLDVDAIVDELLELGIPDFHELWEASSPQEKIILATLGALRGRHGIATRQDVSSALSRRGMRADQNEVVEALDSLAARDILERLGALSYRFNVGLLRTWLGKSKRPDEVYREIRWPVKAKPSESQRRTGMQPGRVQLLTAPETHPWWVRWIIVMLAFAVLLLLLPRAPSSLSAPYRPSPTCARRRELIPGKSVSWTPMALTSPS
jgi:hypothetical protein